MTMLPNKLRQRAGGRLGRVAALVGATVMATLAIGAGPAQAAADIYIPAGTPICVYYDDYCDIAGTGFHAAAHCYGHYPYLTIDGPRERSDVWVRFSGSGYSNWYVPKAYTGPRPGLPVCPGTVGP
jgi:hypothetical protein